MKGSEARRIMYDMIDKGYALVDEQNCKWYGQDAKDRIPHLAGEKLPAFVWWFLGISFAICLLAAMFIK